MINTARRLSKGRTNTGTGKIQFDVKVSVFDGI